MAVLLRSSMSAKIKPASMPDFSTKPRFERGFVFCGRQGRGWVGASLLAMLLAFSTPKQEHREQARSYGLSPMERDYWPSAAVA
jgi:hypothetical protein